MDPRIHVVNRTHHALDSCPCPSCVKERKRRGILVPSRDSCLDSSQAHLINMSPRVAYLFGYIKSLNSHGSLARQIRDFLEK